MHKAPHFHKFYKIIDTVYNYLTPLLAFLIVLDGFLKEIDIHSFKIHHPYYSHAIVKFSNYLPDMILITGSLVLLLELFRLMSPFKKTYSNLDKELNLQKSINATIGQSIQIMLAGYLLTLSNDKLQLQSEDRVTLYLHDKCDNFFQFGRYSPNPKFRKAGRSIYNDDQGVLSLGWQKGWFCDSNNGDKNFIDYNKSSFGMPVKTLANLVMKSKFFAAKRITNKQGHSLGVLIVESLKAQRFKEEEIKQALDSQEIYLADLITALSNHIPYPSIAENEGL